MRLVQILGATALAVVLTACSAPAADPVRDQFGKRDVLPSCGAVVLDQGQMVEEHPKELACLEEALQSGDGGELKVQQPTTEGDPIVSYYRVLRDGSAEIYVDGTADQYGPQQWSFVSCKKPQSSVHVNC